MSKTYVDETGVDILIGYDLYWFVMNQKVIKDDDGIAATLPVQIHDLWINISEQLTSNGFNVSSESDYHGKSGI